MGVETAVPAPENRLALAVIVVPVSAARAGLGRALRRNGDGGYAEFGGLLAHELADVADGSFGEALVQFSFCFDVLARRGGGTAGGCHHGDGVRMVAGILQELPSMTTPSQSVEIYCFKCKAKTGSKDIQVITMKNGRPATRSTCTEYGTEKFRIGVLS